MYWLDKRGGYYVGSKTQGAINCAPRPGVDYKLIPDPRSNPMNCWTPKTQSDLDAEADAEATDGWKNNNDNDKLLMLLYTIDARLRVLENKATIDKSTFWSQFKTFLRTNKFFDF